MNFSHQASLFRPSALVYISHHIKLLHKNTRVIELCFAYLNSCLMYAFNCFYIFNEWTNDFLTISLSFCFIFTALINFKVYEKTITIMVTVNSRFYECPDCTGKRYFTGRLLSDIANSR